MEAEQVTAPEAAHGEGPVWSADWGGLRFVDLLAGDILSVRESSVTRVHVADVAAAIRPRARGGIVVAVERGFALVDLAGEVHRLPELWSDRNLRMNDGGCDPQGRFYCGTYAPAGYEREGALYRLDGDGAAVAVLRGVAVSNGLAWSPDGATAYYIDTATRRIDALDHDPVLGLMVSTRRPITHCPEGLGYPDGMTVDAEGYLWVAHWGGSAVYRYAPDGRCDGRVTLPVSGVTACTFGGPELDELYVTTSRLGIDGDTQPEAGAVFCVRPGITGLPTSAYIETAGS